MQLRGTFRWQGKEMMKTSVAAEYLVTIGMNYAIAYKAAELLRLRSKHGVMPHPSKSEDSCVMASTCPWEQWPGAPLDLNYLECPDLKFPFVHEGLGAQKQDHPDATRLQDTVVDDDLREAMEFERCHSSDEIDEFRQRQLDAMLIMVAKLDGRRQKWLTGIPSDIFGVAKMLHGPFAGVLEEWSECPDRGLETSFQTGFPFVGFMEDYTYGTGGVDVYPKDILLVPEFVDKMYENNKHVIDSLKETEDAAKILEATEEDVAEERMSKVSRWRSVTSTSHHLPDDWQCMNSVIILELMAIGDCEWLITTPSRL